MAAAVLSRTMGSLLEIELVESDQIATVGVGEATIPQIRLLTSLLGVDENDFLSQCQGTMKLGIQFNDWGQIGDSYMHAFGPIGRGLGMLNFYPYWLRSREQGNRRSLWDYSFNYQAAIADRFERLTKLGDTGLAGLVHAFHLDATLVAAFLRRFSTEQGVVRTEGKIVDTVLREPDGFIEALQLEDGRRIDGELFIDCSGFRGLLIEQALKTGYEDWTHWLPCDRAVVVPSAPTEKMRPYTQSNARPAGWQWRIPLQHRTGNGHVYCSSYIGDDEARRILLDNLESEALDDPRILRFATGRRRKFWNRNCVAIGLASGFMEPLESTSIHLVQSALSRLLTMFPDRRFSEVDIAEYNRQTEFEYERIRDFLILHYYANERTNSEFWLECAQMDIPETLREKIDLFRSNGRIVREGDELFTEVAWLQVFIGQGIVPEGHHPMANMLSDEQLADFLTKIREVVAKGVTILPLHRDYIASHCAAKST